MFLATSAGQVQAGAEMPTKRFRLPWRSRRSALTETAQPPTPTSTQSSVIQSFITSQPVQTTSSKDPKKQLHGREAAEDLWDRAYEAVALENSSLLQKYENFISEQSANDHRTVQAGSLASVGSSRRQEQLRAFVDQKLEALELSQWTLKLGDNDISVREQADKLIKLVIVGKDFIGAQLSAEPHAALAWTGICLLLPFLLNPTEQRTAAHEGLEDIPFMVRRYSEMERLCRKDRGLNQGNRDPLIKDFEAKVTELYKTIYEFQIRAVCQFSRHWAAAYGRDVWKADAWSVMSARIRALDGQCSRLGSELSAGRLEQKVDDGNTKINEMSADWCNQFQRQIEGTSLAAAIQIKHQKEWRQTDEERNCCQVLRMSNPYENQKNRTPAREGGTCLWFLQNDKFLSWRANEGSDLLWVSAQPGSGKSVLAKSLIDEQLLISSTYKPAVCYFFFKDISSYQRSLSSAFSAILHQLFSQRPTLIKHALLHFALNGKEYASNTNILWTTLLNASSDPDAGEIICVIDALDECAEVERLDFINFLRALATESRSTTGQQRRLKFLVTSRPYWDIERNILSLVSHFPTIHLSGDEESNLIKQEIDQVIQLEISKISREKDMDQESSEYLLNQILQVENRTYLWISLIVEHIRTSPLPATPWGIQQMISELPRSVVSAYESILQQCENPELAKKLLHIIVGAYRPLTVDEVNIALALATGPRCSSYEDLGLESRMAFEKRLKRICSLFVVVDKSSVYLIHQTAKDFLVRQSLEDEPPTSHAWNFSLNFFQSNIILAQACMSLLMFEVFNHPLKQHEAFPNSTFDDYPFLKYSAVYWNKHWNASGVKNDKFLDKAIQHLCDTTSARSQLWQQIRKDSGDDSVPPRATDLILASALGLSEAVRAILAHKIDLEAVDDHGATALQHAISSGDEDTARMLLEAGARVNVNGWDIPWHDEENSEGSIRQVKPFCGPPIWMAAARDEPNLVHLLLEYGAEVDIQFGENSVTPLAIAALFGLSGAMEILIRHGAKASIQNRNGMSLWHSAACSDEEQLALLTKYGTTGMDEPAFAMLLTGTEELSKADGPLVETEVEDGEYNMGLAHEVTICNPTNMSAQMATTNPDIEPGSNAESMALNPEIEKWMVGATPLHFALQDKRADNARLLVKYGASLEARDGLGRTAAQVAKMVGIDL